VFTVIPIKDLLSRIRWDPAFGDARFTIGYQDRTKDRIVLVPFRELSFPADSPALFELIDDEGCLHSIPLHRVRQVFRDGELIWERQG
jgi:uncharacterized protein (UPF0248 family)